MLTLYHRNVSANGGPDAVPMLLSFYMMFCPSGAACSLDAKRAAKKRGTVAEPLIVPWGVRLLQMQICLIYFQSCVIRAVGPLARRQPALRLVQSEFGMFNLEWLAQYPVLINMMTHGALLRIHAGVLAVVPADQEMGLVPARELCCTREFGRS